MAWIDIDKDRDGLRVVEEIQSGGHSIPTIVFPDGSHLIEPSDDELARKLGLALEASRQFYELTIIGGGPAGLAAALYAARLTASQRAGRSGPAPRPRVRTGHRPYRRPPAAAAPDRALLGDAHRRGANRG